MNIQLWSYNYAPEPTGIGPVSTAWARAMRDRGHKICVVAAHPHYPSPQWGSSWKPYNETLDGIAVTRLPLWVGRGTASVRMRQEASFATSQLLALPMLGGCDAVVAVSPCFPALTAAILNKRIRGTPWVLWLQDILPDGAVSTGIISDGMAIRAARKLERAAYQSADRIAVISRRFEESLLYKGVPQEKIRRIYNPATRGIAGHARMRGFKGPPRILAMGNIGQSQGLTGVVSAFEASSALESLGARLVITGTGVAAKAVAAAVKTDRVELLGVVSDQRLGDEIERAWLGLVSQRSDFPEFNLPSKLMNYFAGGLPVIAWVGPDSEVAELVRTTQSGWVVPHGHDESFGVVIAKAVADADELRTRGENGRRFAVENLGLDALAVDFEGLLTGVAA